MPNNANLIDPINQSTSERERERARERERERGLTEDALLSIHTTTSIVFSLLIRNTEMYNQSPHDGKDHLLIASDNIFRIDIDIGKLIHETRGNQYILDLHKCKISQLSCACVVSTAV
jgi:hypothetical protein